VCSLTKINRNKEKPYYGKIHRQILLSKENKNNLFAKLDVLLAPYKIIQIICPETVAVLLYKWKNFTKNQNDAVQSEKEKLILLSVLCERVEAYLINNN